MTDSFAWVDNSLVPAFRVVPYTTSRIEFYSGAEVVGTLYLESPMRFEGKADEGARLFFECVVKQMLDYLSEQHA